MSVALVGQAGDASSGALGPCQIGRVAGRKQPVLDDYERAIGGELPERTVAVWLIAASAFQKRKGICSYAKIRLKSDKGEVFIGP